MDETNWLQVGDVLDNFLLLEGTCEDLNALHEPLFLDVVVDTINPPDGSTETSLLQVESSPSPDVSDGKLLPFPCLKCPKSFQFRSRLQRHMTTHQVQIPEHCPKACTTPIWKWGSLWGYFHYSDAVSGWAGWLLKVAFSQKVLLYLSFPQTYEHCMSLLQMHQYFLKKITRNPFE